ncbi:MAG: FAD-dependent oxidoreductase [Armatimonadia bacterium]
MTSQYDLIVVGGGAGGTGAAITAGRLGLRTLWVEKERCLGGTGVHALVNVWQPSHDRGALAREIAERMVAEGTAIYVVPIADTPSRRLIHRRAPKATYEDSQRRWADKEKGLIGAGVSYEPAAMARTLADMAHESSVEVLLETTFIEARKQGDKIASLLLRTPEGEREVAAPQYIDATADIVLARSAGCAYALGRESRDEYDEPSAPEKPEFRLNGCTLCFNCRTGPSRVLLPHPAGPEGSSAHISQMPYGGYNVNMCLQLPGEVAWRMGPEQARDCLVRNIARRWPGVREAYGLDRFSIVQIAPRIGMREGPRLRARYVLTEQDHQRGGAGDHPDCVVWTDHAIDRHSHDGGCTEAGNGPVGIPLRCLQPREIGNLLVASRGAGFSSLAASAVRLQRTIMGLGEAAARAVAS